MSRTTDASARQPSPAQARSPSGEAQQTCADKKTSCNRFLQAPRLPSRQTARRVTSHHTTPQTNKQTPPTRQARAPQAPTPATSATHSCRQYIFDDISRYIFRPSRLWGTKWLQVCPSRTLLAWVHPTPESALAASSSSSSSSFSAFEVALLFQTHLPPVPPSCSTLLLHPPVHPSSFPMRRAHRTDHCQSVAPGRGQTPSAGCYC